MKLVILVLSLLVSPGLVGALDYFTPYLVPTPWDVDIGGCNNLQSSHKGVLSFNYTNGYENVLNLSNLLLEQQDDGAYHTLNAGGVGTTSYDMIMQVARSKYYNFTVDDKLADKNISLAILRSPNFQDGFFVDGFSLNNTLVNRSDGNILIEYVFSLEGGYSNTTANNMVIPVSNVTVPLVLSPGDYSLKVDFSGCANLDNYFSKDILLLARDSNNGVSSLIVSNLNTSYHVPGVFDGVASDGVGVYSVYYESIGLNGLPVLSAGLFFDRSFSSTLHGFLNGTWVFNVTVTDLYGVNTSFNMNRVVYVASDVVMESVYGMDDNFLKGQDRGIFVQVFNNGSSNAVGNVINMTMDGSYVNSTSYNLSVGERINVSIPFSLSGIRGGAWHDFSFVSLNNSIEYLSDNTQSFYRKIAYTNWSLVNNVSLYWKNTSFYLPNGSNLSFNVTPMDSDFMSFDIEASDYGVSYIVMDMGVDCVRLDTDDKVLLIKLYNESSSVWENVSVDGSWILDVETSLSECVYTLNLTHTSIWGVSIEDQPVVPNIPASSGGGSGRRRMVVVANDIDWALSEPVIYTLRSRYDVVRYNASNFSASVSGSVKVVLGGFEALGGMGVVVSGLVVDYSTLSYIPGRGGFMLADSQVVYSGAWDVYMGLSREETARLFKEEWG